MKDRSRRDALRAVAAAGAISVLTPAAFTRLLAGTGDADDAIAERTISLVREGISPSAEMGAVVLAVARRFLGAPYRSGTLEVEGQERLVVNLREFDCVTLVESTLAIARCVSAGYRSADDFRSELTRIRYRDGVLNGYISRLHYFSDWIKDNEHKGLVTDLTGRLGGVPEHTTLNFMSSRPRVYPRLRDPAVREAIRTRESDLSARPRMVLPYRLLPAALSGISDGDILGITTNVRGLDIAHTGFAAHVDGRVHFLHAPLSGGVVNISTKPLEEMLGARRTPPGIIVARPLRLPAATPGGRQIPDTH
jgi:hypothetical protein